jgi:hypothetical protein
MESSLVRYFGLVVLRQQINWTGAVLMKKYYPCFHASSRRVSERMATHVGSVWIWLGGGRIVHTLVESGDFPSPHHIAVRALYRDAWDLGCRRRLGCR